MEKTISIPDDLDARISVLTQELHLSESEIYERAARGFVAQHDRAELSRRLNEVYSDPEATAIDPAMARMQYLTMKKHHS